MTFSERTPTAEVETSTNGQRRKRHNRPRWYRLRRILHTVHLRVLAVVLIAVILVALVAGLAFLTDASTRVQGSLASLQRLVLTINKKPGTELTLDDFTRVQASVTDLGNNIRIAQRQTAFLRPFAGLNSDLHTQLDVLDITNSMTQATDQMMTGLEPTLFFLLGGKDKNATATSVPIQGSAGMRVAELLELGRGQFISAQDQLAAAQTKMDSLPLAQLSSGVFLNVENLRTAQSKIQQINNLLLEGPDLLNTAMGLNSAQNYLVLSQNSDELRPSGGYISTYGWISVRSGRITGYDYGATSAVSPNAPATTVASPYAFPNWWIHYTVPMLATWDGSWSPDFPTTAAMSKWFYDNGHNPQAPVSGVVGIDMIGFQYLLNAIGTVNVPEYNQTVTPDNFRAMVYDIREHGSGDDPHKRFLAALYKQIFAVWHSASDQQTSQQLLTAILQGLVEKHIMIYLPDQKLNNALDVLGWSGRQDITADHDYLMAVDANLGNKSNSSVVRQLTYDVEINPDGSLTSRTGVNYDFPASLADKDPAVDPPFNGPRDYANLLQLYTPAGTSLTASRGLDKPPVTASADPRNIIVSQFVVGYNSSQNLQFDYHIPPLIESFGPYQRYRLLAQKQPGTRGDPLSVQVTLPKGATLVSSSPAPAASYSLDQPVLEFRLTLTTDQWVDIVYQIKS